jgi:hypothetical protein
MLHARLDLSRRAGSDVCPLSERGEHLDQLAVLPDLASLRTLAQRISEVHGSGLLGIGVWVFEGEAQPRQHFAHLVVSR